MAIAHGYCFLPHRVCQSQRGCGSVPSDDGVCREAAEIPSKMQGGRHCPSHCSSLATESSLSSSLPIFADTISAHTLKISGCTHCCQSIVVSFAYSRMSVNLCHTTLWNARNAGSERPPCMRTACRAHQLHVKSETLPIARRRRHRLDLFANQVRYPALEAVLHAQSLLPKLT